MAAILKFMYNGYFYAMNELNDPRSDGYPLMDSPVYPIIICFGYLYLIFKALPKYMENRAAYNLDKVLMVFNLTQVLVNFYIFYHAFRVLLPMNWACEPIDYRPTPENLFITRTAYIFFLTKVADLLDTIFFILRKKSSQVTFLHVYHHFGMIAITWGAVKFVAGGSSIFIGVVNSFVHVVMYSYYFVTTLKPEYKKNIWWKKYITQLQLAQFAFFVVLYTAILLQPSCKYPKFVPIAIVPQNFFMIALFGDFYWKAYIKPKKVQ